MNYLFTETFLTSCGLWRCKEKKYFSDSNFKYNTSHDMNVKSYMLKTYIWLRFQQKDSSKTSKTEARVDWCSLKSSRFIRWILFLFLLDFKFSCGHSPWCLSALFFLLNGCSTKDTSHVNNVQHQLNTCLSIHVSIFYRACKKAWPPNWKKSINKI